MDGVHDMGGMHGFGPLPIEADEAVFHYAWEGRVFAINLAMLAVAGKGLDAGRAGWEKLPAAEYLSLPYFGRWLSSSCAGCVASGLLSEDQMAAIQAGQLAEIPKVAGSGESSPGPRSALDLAIKGVPAQREIAAPSEFEIGQTVRARTLHSATHTRLPRYVRGRVGAVVADRGGHVYPDSNALGLGEDPRRLYAVQFSARELWGEGANSKDNVTLDLWEPYLEPA
jgi:nitrile hydratase beta subunit